VRSAHEISGKCNEVGIRVPIFPSFSHSTALLGTRLFGPGNWFRSLSCATNVLSPCLQFGRKISVTLICRCCSLANGFCIGVCSSVGDMSVCVWVVAFPVFLTANCWWGPACCCSCYCRHCCLLSALLLSTMMMSLGPTPGTIRLRPWKRVQEESWSGVSTLAPSAVHLMLWKVVGVN